MTSTQLKKMLESAKISQRQAAKELEINERTMRKYISGELAIPKTVELALCWIVHLQKIS